jgi:hypothetical protein
VIWDHQQWLISSIQIGGQKWAEPAWHHFKMVYIKLCREPNLAKRRKGSLTIEWFLDPGVDHGEARVLHPNRDDSAPEARGAIRWENRRISKPRFDLHKIISCMMFYLKYIGKYEYEKIVYGAFSPRIKHANEPESFTSPTEARPQLLASSAFFNISYLFFHRSNSYRYVVGGFQDIYIQLCC